MRRHTLVTIVASGLVGLMAFGTSAHEPPAAAGAESSGAMVACVTSSQDGAIGRRSRAPILVSDGAISAVHPDARRYDALQDGELRVVRVEYLVLAKE